MIKLNASYLSSLMKKLIVIGVLFSVVIFFGLDIDLSYRYFLSMLFVFIGLLIVFYLNKNEPESLKFQGEKLEFTFFNKVFFKKKVIVCKKEEVSLQVSDKALTVFKNKELIAVIRISSISSEDLIDLKSYFLEE